MQKDEKTFIGLFPAHAGVIPVPSRIYHEKRTFPRTCGGDPLTDPVTELKDDFSPHMRG